MPREKEREGGGREEGRRRGREGGREGVSGVGWDSEPASVRIQNGFSVRPLEVKAAALRHKISFPCNLSLIDGEETAFRQPSYFRLPPTSRDRSETERTPKSLFAQGEETQLVFVIRIYLNEINAEVKMEDAETGKKEREKEEEKEPDGGGGRRKFGVLFLVGCMLAVAAIAAVLVVVFAFRQQPEPVKNSVVRQHPERAKDLRGLYHQIPGAAQGSTGPFRRRPDPAEDRIGASRQNSDAVAGSTEGGGSTWIAKPDDEVMLSDVTFSPSHFASSLWKATGPPYKVTNGHQGPAK
ncbi:unnamed protein product [Darwinula stevensoni]|uniref:Uncharacterized protein n=1 Tax=Darwinula stevensoni TaxID=69355 RepID=A0A7R8X8H2_9CRUS|nr:unnamed protein product [Darwinula stevensoni]CAG0887929.1 unnamed protein product [Darwinula stevensoni]